MITDLTDAYIIAADRSHRSRMTIHIYYVSDVFTGEGYILASDLYVAQLSQQYRTFEHIDSVYPDTRVERTQ